MKFIIIIGIIAFILAFHFFAYQLSYLSYSRIVPGSKVILSLEKYQFYEVEDIVVKVENGILFTKNNGAFTFKDYLNNTII